MPVKGKAFPLGKTFANAINPGISMTWTRKNFSGTPQEPKIVANPSP
jgi:hypothetical protein